MCDFYPNAFCVWLHGDVKEVLKVRITEDPIRDRQDKNGYWGWWDLEGVSRPEPFFQFVYAHQTLLNMCFPYGPEAEENRGKGMRFPVKIEVLETIDKK